MPLLILILLFPAKIVATSFTISSGGSGGVFAPSLVIGGVTGAVFASLANRVAPALAPPAAACVLVGMGGFFAGVAKVPIASLIMVAEMSGSYSLLVPMMLVTSVAFLLTRGVSASTRRRCPAGWILRPTSVTSRWTCSSGSTVREVMDPDQDRDRGGAGNALPEGARNRRPSEQHAFPVVRRATVWSGRVQRHRRAPGDGRPRGVVGAGGFGSWRCPPRSMAYLELDDDLHTAVRRFTAFRHENLPVLTGPPPSQVVGILGHHRVLEAYDDEVHRLQATEE